MERSPSLETVAASVCAITRSLQSASQRRLYASDTLLVLRIIALLLSARNLLRVAFRSSSPERSAMNSSRDEP